MKKADFIALVAEKAGVTKKDAATVIDAFEDVMLENVFAPNEKVMLKMGTFEGVNTKARAARKGRNPATGEEITIAAVPAKSGQPHVRWSKAAKE